QDLKTLLTLAGIGPYTAGAILSFGFHKKAVAMDGNVLRVAARYFCIQKCIDQSSTRKEMESLVESMLDSHRPWVSMEALIELGALVCTPNPRCELCPLVSSCKGKNSALYLPVKSIKPSIEKLKRVVFVIEAEGKILVRKEG